MKKLKLFAFALVAALLVACATVGTPEQQFYTNATKATQLVDQVVLAADAAVKTGLLKREDAQTTLAVVKAARDGLNVAKTLPFDQGNSKILITIASLTATQAYISTLKATP